MKAAIAMGLLMVAVQATADEGWNVRETRTVREDVYPSIEHLRDFAQIKATFEKGLANDVSSALALASLVRHSNEDVASTAAQMLGRFPIAAFSQVLQNSYSTDARLFVRAAALAGLARMKDPMAATLARAALLEDDEAMQGAGLGALEALGDPTQSSAILDYYDRHPGQLSADALKSLGELGDPPGSTAVRDRLLAEANNKSKTWSWRYDAALGLRAMGQGALVKSILDIAKAEATYDDLRLVKSAIERLAVERSVTIRSQAEVDLLLRDVQLRRRDRWDLWNRPLRVKIVSQGVFYVLSDGPDMLPNTPDDLSTGELEHLYLRRVFPDQFKP